MWFVTEMWQFLNTKRRLWLLPLLVILMLLGVVLILAETTALAPFLYTMF
jgi:hypothetical protein